MITVGRYVKLILRKRNMTQMDLLRKINDLNLGNGKELSRCHLNNFINETGGISFVWARRIEIALELEKYSLVKMLGIPTEQEWKKIEEVKPYV